MTPTNDTNTLPVVTRKREPRVNVPRSKEEETPEQWAERQRKLQAHHTESFMENEERLMREQKAARERKRYLGLKSSSERIDGVEDIPPDEAARIAAEAEGRNVIPPRGPKTDDGGTVIDEGEVPIMRGRTKKSTRVEAARARKEAQQKKQTRKVIM